MSSGSGGGGGSSPPWKAVHEAALAAGQKTYEDPETGYTVLTEVYHRRRGTCCGQGCRHCPYEHRNVGKPPSANNAKANETLEW